MYVSTACYDTFSILFYYFLFFNKKYMVPCHQQHRNTFIIKYSFLFQTICFYSHDSVVFKFTERSGLYSLAERFLPHIGVKFTLNRVIFTPYQSNFYSNIIVKVTPNRVVFTPEGSCSNSKLGVDLTPVRE